MSNSGQETHSSNQEIDLTDLNPYSHEEADTGMFLRAKHAASAGRVWPGLALWVWLRLGISLRLINKQAYSQK